MINRTKKGFTLIELLVVISIIAMLSSIVLSSLSAARAKARDTVRLQNINQLETAANMYANDNGGNFPPAGTPTCLGKATGIGCWKNLAGRPVGSDTVNTAFSKYITLPQDPLSNRTTGGDSYLYLNNPGSQGAAFHCTASLINGPMILWIPDEGLPSDASDVSCKGKGVAACCASIYCTQGRYCAYLLN